MIFGNLLKNLASDSHKIRPVFKGNFVIATHTHGKLQARKIKIFFKSDFEIAQLFEATMGLSLQIIRPQPEKGPQYLEIQADEKYLLNPGSVGQPRDGDWRAAFAIYDTEDRLVVFYRHEYDLQTAQGKILSAGLPPHLASRLSVGR